MATNEPHHKHQEYCSTAADAEAVRADFTVSPNGDCRYAAPELVSALNLPASDGNLWDALLTRMPEDVDRVFFRKALERLTTQKNATGFFRLRTGAGLYWWSVTFERTDEGAVRGWAYAFDERYCLAILRDAKHRCPWCGLMEALLKLADDFPGHRLWYDRRGSIGRFSCPTCAGFCPLPADAPAPAATAVDCGLLDRKGELFRTLSDVFLDADEVELARHCLLMSVFDGAFDDIEFVFQPTVGKDEKTVEALEMLARLRTGRIAVSPAFFVSVLEAGLAVIPFGRVVLEKAARAAEQMTDAGLPIEIAINYSPIQSLDEDFAPFLDEILARHRCPTNGLAIELTESMPVSDPVRLQAHFMHCHELGMKTAIDDFGTKFNSLEVFLAGHYDVVKFGGHLARQLLENPETDTFLGNLIRGCHALGCRVCIECVECKDELSRIRVLGADRYQGFYFGKGVSLDRFLADQKAAEVP